jgi:hypothetical protein
VSAQALLERARDRLAKLAHASDRALRRELPAVRALLVRARRLLALEDGRPVKLERGKPVPL